MENLDHMNELREIKLAKNKIKKVRNLPVQTKKVDLSDNLLEDAKFQIRYPLVQWNLSGNPIPES